MEVLRKKRNGLVEDMKSRNEESKQIESEILQKGLEIETVNSQNKNFIKVRLLLKKSHVEIFGAWVICEPIGSLVHVKYVNFGKM